MVRRAPLAVNPRDNSRYRDWANATSTTIRRCNIQPFLQSNKKNQEIDAGREFTKTLWQAFFPPGSDILSSDLVDYAGNTYEVLAEPGRWRFITGQERYTSVILVRREG